MTCPIPHFAELFQEKRISPGMATVLHAVLTGLAQQAVAGGLPTPLARSFDDLAGQLAAGRVPRARWRGEWWALLIALDALQKLVIEAGGCTEDPIMLLLGDDAIQQAERCAQVCLSVQASTSGSR
jgi:hypothetical protein